MKNYVYCYISAIFFAGISSWGGVLFNFMYILIFDQFPSQIWNTYFIIQGGFLFILHIIWILGVLKLSTIEDKKRRILGIIVGILNLILQVTYWIIIFSDIGILGAPSFPFVVTYSPVSYFYLTASLLYFTIACGWLAIMSVKSDDQKIKLRGKFLLIYVILITIGSIFEIYDPLETIIVQFYSIAVLDAAVIASIIAKIILTLAVFSGYVGFMLPKRIKKIFLKE